MQARSFLSLLLPAALAACGPTEAAPADGADRPRKVLVEPATSGELHREHRYFGVVRAARRAELAFAVGGRLEARPVQIGDRVEAGELLARLDGRRIGQSVRAARAGRDDARARLAQLERDRDRLQRLIAAEAAGAEELEKVTSALASARAQVAGAEAGLAESERSFAETRLVAPFAATVTDVRLEPGEFARPGQPVIALSGSSALEVEVEVPEAVRTLLRRGQEARVELPLAELTAAGTIRHLGTASPTPGRLFPVIVALEDAGGVVAGLTAEVVFESRIAPSISVPVSAVLDPAGGEPFVFTVAGDRVEAEPVEVIEVVGSRARIRGEVAAGDRVVVAGHANLVTGQRVRAELRGER